MWDNRTIVENLRGHMNRNSAKKIGKRGANTWGRPGTPKLKRAASKAVRKERIDDEFDIEKSEYDRRLDVLALKGLDKDELDMLNYMLSFYPYENRIR
jgi:hypothetical protein